MTTTTKYELLHSGYIRIIETGAVCPGRGGNYISDAVIAELISAGCAQEDHTGLILFKPDGKILTQEAEATVVKPAKKSTKTQVEK